LLEGVESSDNMDENSTVAKKDSHVEFRSCLLDNRLEADKSVTDVSRKNENDSISVNPKTNEVASKSYVVEAKKYFRCWSKESNKLKRRAWQLKQFDEKAKEKITELDGAKKCIPLNA